MTTKQTRYIKQPEYVGRILVFPVMTTDVEIRTFERINIFCLNSSTWFELTAHSEGCLLHPDPISYGLVEVEVQGSLHFKYWYFDCRKKGFLSSNSNPTCAHMFWPVLLFSALSYSPSASSSRSTSRPLYWCETMCLHNGKNPGSYYLAVSHVNCYMTLEITKVFTWNRTEPILQDIYLDRSTKVFPMRFVCLHFVFHHHVKLPNCKCVYLTVLNSHTTFLAMG